MLKSSKSKNRQEEGQCKPLDVVQQLRHHIRPLVSRLHLLQLELLQDASNECVQRYRDDLGLSISDRRDG